MNIEKLKEIREVLKGFRENIKSKGEELTTHKDLREHLAGEALSDAADFIHRAIRNLEVEEEEKEATDADV